MPFADNDVEDSRNRTHRVNLAVIACLLVATVSVVGTRATFAQIQQAQLTVDDAEIQDGLGVACSIDGDVAVVGAINAGDSGAAYVFMRTGTTWTKQATVVADDISVGAFFGGSVSTDGNTIVVGASGDNVVGTQSGSAFVFVRMGGLWVLQTKLVAADAAAFDHFGDSVAIHGDTIVVGAGGDDDNGDDSGSAYVFVLEESTWVQSAKLSANDGSQHDNFGSSAAIHADTILIGAFGTDEVGNRSGSAYVFVQGGQSWTQQAKLTADDAGNQDLFGFSVAIDGDRALIGSRDDDLSGGRFNAGSAYLFVRNGTIWTQEAKLTADDASESDRLGASVAIDGVTAVVGASGGDAGGILDSGAAYVFVKVGPDWIQRAKLTADDTATQDSFGRSVATDNDTCIVGANGSDAVVLNGGSAYAFANLRNASNLGARSLLSHSDVELAINLFASHGIEPRLGGPLSLVFDMSADMDESTVTVDHVQLSCVSQTAPEVADVMLIADRSVVVELAEAFTDADCCKFSFDGMLTVWGGVVPDTFAVTALEGDVYPDGKITGADALLIKPHFGEIAGVDLADPPFDFDRSGEVTGSDFLLIKPLLGNVADECP